MHVPIPKQLQVEINTLCMFFVERFIIKLCPYLDGPLSEVQLCVKFAFVYLLVLIIWGRS